MDKKVVRGVHNDVVRPEQFLRKVLEICGDDYVRPLMNGSRYDMPILWIR